MVDFTDKPGKQPEDPKRAGRDLLAEQGLGHSDETSTGSVGDVHTMPEHFLPSRRRAVSFRPDSATHGKRVRSRLTVILIVVVVGVLLIAAAAWLFSTILEPDQPTTNANIGNTVTNTVNNGGNANQGTNQPLPVEPFIDASHGFTIDVPEDWSVKQNVSSARIVTFSAPEADKDGAGNLGTASISIHWQTHESAVNEPLDLLTAIGADDELINAVSQAATIDGRTGVFLIGQSSRSLIPTTELRAAVLYDDIDVAIIASANSDAWARYSATFEKVATSFRRTSATNSNSNGNGNANGNGNTNIGNRNTNTFINTNTLLPDSPDSDDDELTDVEESLYATTVNKPDTDGDGFLDGAEVINGYHPSSGNGATLAAGESVKTYSNPTAKYAVLYPASWLAQATSAANDEVIFTSDGSTGEFVSIRSEENPSLLSPKQWYLNLSPGVDPNAVETIAVGSLIGARSPDGRTVYISSGVVMFVMSYNTGGLTQINYRTTFRMMVNQFRLQAQSPTSNGNGNANVTNTNGNTNS